jgi:hypothetical protein
VITPNATIDVHADYRLDPASFNIENTFRVFDPNRAPVATGGFPSGIAMQRGAVPKITVNPGCDTVGQPGNITLHLSSRLDVASDKVWRDESEFDFTLETVGKAKVTLLIDGLPVTEPLQLLNETTGAMQLLASGLDNEPLASGTITSSCPRTQIHETKQYRFVPAVAFGGAASSIGGTASQHHHRKPAGRAHVQGVDLWDGHRSPARTWLPGRGLSLISRAVLQRRFSHRLGRWLDAQLLRTPVRNGSGHFTVGRLAMLRTPH